MKVARLFGRLGLGLLTLVGDPRVALSQPPPPPPPSPIFTIPIRWCAAGRTIPGTSQKEGSPVWVDPGRADGSPTTDDALWKRHERASDGTYIPMAGINLRSGITNAVRADPLLNFPIIPDPGTGPGFGGEYGDVVEPFPADPTKPGSVAQFGEVSKFLHDCDAAWSNEHPDFMRNTGLLALNVKRILLSATNPVPDAHGVALVEHGNPPLRHVGAGGKRVLLEDRTYTLLGSPDLKAEIDGRQVEGGSSTDVFLAHELGHSWPLKTPGGTIGLRHAGLNTVGLRSCGTALDPDQLNMMRSIAADVFTPKDHILDNFRLSGSIAQLRDTVPMTGSLNCETVDQIGLLRDGAGLVGGCRIDGSDLECPIHFLSDYQMARFGNLVKPHLDILRTIFTEVDGVTGLDMEVLGNLDTLTEAVAFDYIWLVDLDGNPATGGNPADLGIPSAFRGADWVTEVQVKVARQPREDGLPGPFRVTAAPKTWRNVEGFEPIFDLGTVAAVPIRRYIVDRFDGSAPEAPAPSMIRFEMPSGLLPSRVNTFRMQALSRETASPTLIADRLDESPTETGAVVQLTPPQYPTCELTPNVAQTGATVSVRTGSLMPNKGVHVIFGDTPVGTGVADAAGTATVPFKIPIGIRGGPHLVTVGSDHTALTGDCVMNVQLPPACANDTVAPTFKLVPSARTISSCQSPDIGLATAVDACGPVSVSNDAPLHFPLGTTTVTWRAVDPSGNAATATQRITAVLGDDASCCPANTNIIAGTDGSDVLRGTEGRDCILGRGGDDVIDALGGDDVVSGGEGRDTINSGLGNDVVSGGPGDDIIDAGPGNDRVTGDAGRDTIMAGTGSDTIDGGPDTDTCSVPTDGTDHVSNCEVH
jgi:hypothetical protein